MCLPAVDVSRERSRRRRYDAPCARAEPGAAAVSLAAMISIFAALNGSILSGSRVPYALAKDGLFFRACATVHPVFSTPSNSILLLSVWSSVLVLTGRYEELYTLVIFPSWILYAMATASVIVLRRTRPDLPRPYKTIGYPVVPVLFVLVAGALILSTLFKSPRESVLGLGIIAAGIAFLSALAQERPQLNTCTVPRRPRHRVLGP